MSTETLAAIAFALATLPPCLAQIALALGAPWGQITLGGKWPGRLPGRMRLAAVAQAAILAGLTAIVLDHAGLISLGLPDWAIWIAVVISCLTALLNNITPSQIERRLWGLPTVIMAIAALTVATV